MTPIMILLISWLIMGIISCALLLLMVHKVYKENIYASDIPWLLVVILFGPLSLLIMPIELGLWFLKKHDKTIIRAPKQ